MYNFVKQKLMSKQKEVKLHKCQNTTKTFQASVQKVSSSDSMSVLQLIFIARVTTTADI